MLPLTPPSMPRRDIVRILLVDDNAGSLSRVHELLSASDLPEFTLECVTTYFAAAGSFALNSYNACIIDSPGGNARSLIAQARRLGAVLPIIVLTSNSADEVLEAMRSGAADCLKRGDLTAPLLERTICSAIERARLARSRLENEQRYLSLTENVNVFIYTHDLNGNYTSLNRAGERLTGYRSEEVLRMNILQTISPEYHDLIRQMIRRKLEEQIETRYTVDILTKSGRRVPVYVSTHLIFENGRAIGVQGIAREVSNSKQLDVVLSQNNLKYAELTRPRQNSLQISTKHG